MNKTATYFVLLFWVSISSFAQHWQTNFEQVKAQALNENKSIVFSDKSTSYVDICDYVEIHSMEKSTTKTTKSTLKWVHVAISNAKRTMLGIYHKINGKYLQLYLDEFCYKLNRRYYGENLFNRLTLAVAKTYW